MEKQKEFEKQVYENQETAIKLLQENIKLKTTMNELKEEIKNLTDDSEDTTMYEIALTCKELLLEIIEKGEKNERDLYKKRST